jgi:hypothetical protein
LNGRFLITIGPDNKSFYVYKKEIHKFALVDIEQFGKKAMRKDKIAEIRYCMKLRRERESSYLYDRLYDYLKKQSTAKAMDLDNWLEAEDESAIQSASKLWRLKSKK